MLRIAEKLIKITADCGYVQKNGTNSFHQYKYATASDVLEKVNKALVKHCVASVVAVELLDLRDHVNAKGQTEHLATIRATVTLLDAESGETLTLTGLGSGVDLGDKAIMKAQTAAIKYAFLLSFAIATGDDPESDADTDRRNTQTDTIIPVTAKNSAVTPSFHCNVCHAPITVGIERVSTQKHGRPLCLACQKRTAASTTPTNRGIA